MILKALRDIAHVSDCYTEVSAVDKEKKRKIIDKLLVDFKRY